MIREINRDVLFLGRKALPAGPEDSSIAVDLLDTLVANRGKCVGMAANMIGENKAIIVFESGFGRYTTMYNPKIISKSGQYVAEEGCLSLSGARKAVRYQKIKVRFLDLDFKERTAEFSGRVAQIIQHEIDHTNGIIV